MENDVFPQHQPRYILQFSSELQNFFSLLLDFTFYLFPESYNQEFGGRFFFL